jgi:ketosteroid isomerase-like protein
MRHEGWYYLLLLIASVLGGAAALPPGAGAFAAGTPAPPGPEQGRYEDGGLTKVKEFFADFGKGDIPAVLNTLAEDVDWFIPGPVAIPYAGERRGRERVEQFFTSFGDSVEVQKFEPREFIARGDRVVVLGHEVLKVKSTSKVVDNEWAMVFTVGKDKINTFRSYEDTAALAAAFAK